MPAIPMDCKATSPDCCALLAQMPNLPGSTPLGSAGRRHRPGTACLRAASAGLAGAEQSASARARLSAAGQVTARSRGRSRSGNAAQARCRCRIEAPDPPAFQPGADTGRARRHYGHHLAAGIADAGPPRHRATADRCSAKTSRNDRKGARRSAVEDRTGVRRRSARPVAGSGPIDARNAVQPALGRAQRHRPAGRQAN